MWRTVGFVLALALTVGGAGRLVFQLFIAEEFSRNLVVAAAILLAKSPKTQSTEVAGNIGTEQRKPKRSARHWHDWRA